MTPRHGFAAPGGPLAIGFQGTPSRTGATTCAFKAIGITEERQLDCLAAHARTAEFHVVLT